MALNRYPARLVTGTAAELATATLAPEEIAFATDTGDVMLGRGNASAGDYGTEGSSATRAGSATYAPLLYGAGRPWEFFGDSITLGSSATSGNEYYRKVAEILGSSRMAAVPQPAVTATAYPPAGTYSLTQGVAGERSDQILTRLRTRLAASTPRLGGIVFLAGTNDVAQNSGVAAWQANIAAAVSACRAKGIPIVVGTVPPLAGAATSATKRGQIWAMNLWLREFALRANVPLAEVNLALADSTTGDLSASYDSGDGTHPNDAGHLVLAQAFATAVGTVIPAGAPWLTSAGAGKVVNPLMSGTLGNTRPTSWNELTSPTGTAPTYGTLAKSGTLVAGQWAQVDWVATSGGQRGLEQIVGSIVPGNTYMLTCQVEIDDVSGYVAAGSSASWNLRVQNGGNTVFYCLINGQGSTNGLKSTVAAPFIAPAGVTAVVVQAKCVLPNGVSARFRFGGLDLLDLTALGVDLTS